MTRQKPACSPSGAYSPKQSEFSNAVSSTSRGMPVDQYASRDRNRWTRSMSSRARWVATVYPRCCHSSTPGGLFPRAATSRRAIRLVPHRRLHLALVDEQHDEARRVRKQRPPGSSHLASGRAVDEWGRVRNHAVICATDGGGAPKHAVRDVQDHVDA